MSWSRSRDAANVLVYATIGMGLAVLVYLFLSVIAADRLIYISPELVASDSRAVSNRIDISGGGNIAVEVNSNVDNAYLDLELRLIDDARKVAYVVQQDVEYYHGYEGGEFWIEGSRSGIIYFSRIPAGSYVLEAFPLSDGVNVTYSLRVYRDRTRVSYLWWVLGWFGGWILLIVLTRSKEY